MSIEVANESGADVDEHALVSIARHVLDSLGVAPLAELSLVLVDVATMEQLHVKWMGEKGPTDVLAFPMDELDLRGSRGVAQRTLRGPDEADSPHPAVLGDVVLCPEVAERQAQEAGHSTADELALLCAHGVLHLLGYDHGDAEEHAEMFGLQSEPRLVVAGRAAGWELTVLAGSWVAPLCAVVFVLLAAVFAGLEVALSRVSRVRVLELVSEDRPGAGRLETVLADPPRSLNLLLLLRTVCELAAAGIVVAYFLDRRDSPSSVVVAVAVMTVVSYVLVGVAPRTIGRQQAERVALRGARLVLLLTRVFGPLPQLLILLGNAITPGKGFPEGPFASEAELRDLVEMARERGVVERSERDMINSVFELGDTIVREVMVPRTDIVTIERGKTVKQAMNLLLRSGFSRIPVVGDNTDDVLGVAYLKDLVRKERSDNGSGAKVEDVMRDPVFVPESKPVDELLREMQAELGHIAIVVDEYGGTAGLVTIEDVLEEIVGEITDEYDREVPPVEHLADGSVRVTARLPIEDLEEMYDVQLPHEDVDTVAGLLATALGRVPIPGATATLDGLTLVAESAKGRRNRIGTVLVRRTETVDAEQEDGDS